MAALVVGDPLAVVRVRDDLALGAEHDLLERVREVRALDLLVLAASGEQRGLVDQVREVRAHHAGRGLRELLEVHLVVEQDRARVDAQDHLAPFESGG